MPASSPAALDVARLDVAPLDVHDDADAAAAYAVLRASQDHERPWNDQDSLEPTVAEWRFDDPLQRSEMWGVRVDGDLVAIGQLWLPLLDNRDKMWFEVHVRPDHRGHGYGRAVVDRLEVRAREEGRSEMLTEAFVPPGSGEQHPYERFAAATGFALASTDKVRFLDLPVPAGRLDELAATAAAGWSSAYRLETHVDALPDALVEGYCRVSNQLGVDAPTGAVDFEAESLTPELYRQHREVERTQRRARLTTLAIENASGTVVAFTDLVLPFGSPEDAWQGGTLVDRAHRGHRLGTAIKVENLRRLQGDHPERRRVATGNDETNSWMVAINEALGFRVVELCRMYHRLLAA